LLYGTSCETILALKRSLQSQANDNGDDDDYDDEDDHGGDEDGEGVMSGEIANNGYEENLSDQELDAKYKNKTSAQKKPTGE
jgi:hypothetical protein